MNRLLRIPQVALALLACCLLTAPAPAATVAELSELARQSTFEVVLPKIEPAYVTYEKPLPLELLSFTERNDKFWSIGTAFAIGPGVFVSNAHVILSGMGSPMGRPHLRDAAGNTFEVERVLKFSLHEDFVVFSARGAKAARVLEPARNTPVGATIYTVGNALGDGVVLRDGLLTSLTPEDQDGRWKWVRFSAAASPGNSGGPLLDSEGHVIGVVTARSPGENLNYALPISNVLDAGERVASIDIRNSFTLPVLRQQMVTEFRKEFSLPATWPQFVERLTAMNDAQYDASKKRLLEEQAADLPPGGQSAPLLSRVERSELLALIGQQSDDRWALTDPSNAEDVELPGDDKLALGVLNDTISFVFRRDGKHADPAFYRDAKPLMDALLKGLRMPRMIGPQAIRITSLGAPLSEALHQDRFGRAWQMREWSLGYGDLQVLTLALPTPDGYAGLIRLTTAINRKTSLEGLRLMADYTHAQYHGTAAQWRAFTALKDLCPASLRDVRFDKDKGLAIALEGLEVNVPAAVLPLSDESTLRVHTGYRAENGALQPLLAGVTVWSTSLEEDSWIGIWGQPQPKEGAGQEIERRWRQMSERRGEFTGKPNHDPAHTRFWTTSVLGDASQPMQYEVTMSLKEKSLLPRQVSERNARLQSGLNLKPGR